MDSEHNHICKTPSLLSTAIFTLSHKSQWFSLFRFSTVSCQHLDIRTEENRDFLEGPPITSDNESLTSLPILRDSFLGKHSSTYPSFFDNQIKIYPHLIDFSCYCKLYIKIWFKTNSLFMITDNLSILNAYIVQET